MTDNTRAPEALTENAIPLEPSGTRSIRQFYAEMARGLLDKGLSRSQVVNQIADHLEHDGLSDSQVRRFNARCGALEIVGKTAIRDTRPRAGRGPVIEAPRPRADYVKGMFAVADRELANLLSYRLASGRTVREAYKQDLIEQALQHDLHAAGNALKGRFLRAVAGKLKDKQRVCDALTEAQITALWLAAKKV